MLVSDYISQKMASLGLTSSEADILDMGLLGSDELTAENLQSAQIAFVKFIPSILIRPTSISEGGVSISRAQRQDIEAFYKSECSRLGIENVLIPKIRFL